MTIKIRVAVDARDEAAGRDGKMRVVEQLPKQVASNTNSLECHGGGCSEFRCLRYEYRTVLVKLRVSYLLL